VDCILLPISLHRCSGMRGMPRCSYSHDFCRQNVVCVCVVLVLVGKALDPNSAAARAYGLKPDLFARESCS
jgi:hypothetical protein